MKPRTLAIVLLGATTAMLAACTATDKSDGGSSATIQRDRDGVRQGGPTSANPGGSATRESLPSASAPESSTPVPSPFQAKAPSGRPLPGLGGMEETNTRVGNPRIGRSFALDNCRPCHVVAPDQKSEIRFANAPAFRAIANSAITTELGLNVWLTNPHPTMPTLVLSPDESANVIAYILSLRDRR